MTAIGVAGLHCPTCNATTIAALSDGTALCLACRLEWDPASPPSPPVALDVPALVTADSILGPPAEVVDDYDELHDVLSAASLIAGDTIGHDDIAQQWLDQLAGTRVMLEGGQVATVVEVVDADWVRVRIGDDREEVVNFSDVVRSLPTPQDAVDAVDDVDPVALRILTAVGGLLHATAQVARACNVSPDIVADVLDTYRDYEVPSDADLLPIVLGDSIAALQMLAEAFGLPDDLIAGYVNITSDNADKAETEITP